MNIPFNKPYITGKEHWDAAVPYKCRFNLSVIFVPWKYVLC